MNDPIWSERGQTVLDLRLVALIETENKEALKEFIAPRQVGPSESVVITKYEPQRVELSASLDDPGLVILADTYYPGWRLTIDGKSATNISCQSHDVRGRCASGEAHIDL